MRNVVYPLCEMASCIREPIARVPTFRTVIRVATFQGTAGTHRARICPAQSKRVISISQNNPVLTIL